MDHPSGRPSLADSAATAVVGATDGVSRPSLNSPVYTGVPHLLGQHSDMVVCVVGSLIAKIRTTDFKVSATTASKM